MVAVEKFTVDQKLEHCFLFILQISKVKDDLFLIIFFYDGNHVLAITELASEKIFYEELIAILAIFRQVFKNDEIWFEIFGVGEKDEVKLALYVLAVIR